MALPGRKKFPAAGRERGCPPVSLPGWRLVPGRHGGPEGAPQRGSCVPAFLTVPCGPSLHDTAACWGARPFPGPVARWQPEASPAQAKESRMLVLECFQTRV